MRVMRIAAAIAASIGCVLLPAIVYAQTPTACQSFEDDPLTPGVAIRAVHVTQLRTCIDALRAQSSLAPFDWYDADVQAQITPIRAIHVVQLEQALDEVYAVRGGTHATWVESIAPAVVVLASHLSAVRTYIGLIPPPSGGSSGGGSGGSSEECTFDVSPESVSVPSGGSEAMVAVSTTSGCSWSAVSHNDFISILGGSSGTGSGAVTFSVTANPTSESRIGSMTVAGRPIAVVQDVCAVAIFPTDVLFEASGGAVTVGVTTPEPCEWSVTGLPEWMTVASESGFGPAALVVTAAPWSGRFSHSATLSFNGVYLNVVQKGSVYGTQPPLQPPDAAHRQVTILVNGSFNAEPPWMMTSPASPEVAAIMSTYGNTLYTFRWYDNALAAVTYPEYRGIIESGFLLADFINGLGLSQTDDLNIVSHSHGGNVTLIASLLLPRRIQHVINLGTPVNYDLRPIPILSYSHCQVSGVFDMTQAEGASPVQYALWVDSESRALYHSVRATIAAGHGDWDEMAYELSVALYYQGQAVFWWFTMKYEKGADNLFFLTADHGVLHEPSVWNAIKNECALN